MLNQTGERVLTCAIAACGVAIVGGVAIAGTAVRVSLSRKLSPLVSVQDAGPAWERSYNSILTGLADCLPLSAFSGIYQ